jgi:hypothetical protein
MPEQQPVPDEAVRAAARAIAATRNRTLGTEGVWPSDEMAARDAVEAAAPFICAPLEAENAQLREALGRIAYGLEGEMGRYDAPRDNTWWGRIALEALGGDRA